MVRNQSSISATPQQANLASRAPDLSYGGTSGGAKPMLSANPQRSSDSRIETRYARADKSAQPSPLLEYGEAPRINNDRASENLET